MVIYYYFMVDDKMAILIKDNNSIKDIKKCGNFDNKLLF